MTVEEAVECLKREEIVAIPTETVYGLAGVATSSLAVGRIFEAKDRPKDNPLICHFASWDEVKGYVKEMPKAAERLCEEYSDGGPFSLLLELREDSELRAATGGLSTVLCRVPALEVTKKVIAGLGKPLAAPSANTSGRLSPTSAQMVLSDLGEKISGVVDGGECEVGLESTILDLREEGKVKVLRYGGLSMEKLKEVYAEMEVFFCGSKNTVPGAKYRHYSPTAKVVIVNSLREVREGVLVGMERDLVIYGGKCIKMKDAERDLYRSFYEADKAGEVIYFLDNGGFSEGVMDRVRKML